MNKFIQFVLIISGFALGQGSMFLAQTWLVMQEKLELLASVGIGLGILSLIQWAADCGGIYLLPRQLSAENFQQRFWAFVIARLFFSFLFIVCILFLLNLININQITYDIAIYGSISAFVWAFNISGILDNKQLNRIAGPLSGLCWVFAAIPVVLLSDSEDYGTTIGIAYVAGLLVTVLIQFSSLKKANIDLSFAPTPLPLIKKQFTEGSMYNGAYITSQAYGRTIPILVDMSIDSYTAGVYVYAKNIANTASQFVEFSRRIEFSSIIKLINSKNYSVSSIFIEQKISLLIVGFFLFLGILSYIALNYYGNPNYIFIAKVTLILIFILIFWALSSSLGQALVALEKTGYYAVTISITLLISIVIIFLSINHIGLTGVYIGESLMFIIQIALYTSYIKKYAKSDKAC